MKTGQEFFIRRDHDPAILRDVEHRQCDKTAPPSIQRGNNRQVIFASEDDYSFFLDCLAEAAIRHECRIHAYVLMANHVHLLATPHDERSLPKTLQSVGRKYVQYFNCVYQRTGTLWEGRYRATPIDTEVYLLVCARYIELNPVRARMVNRPGEYRWSSYHYNALGKPGPLIAPHRLYTALGATARKRQMAYRNLFRNHLDEDTIGKIRETTNKAWVLGNDRLRVEIEALTGRRSAPLPRGRKKREQRF